jgi:hypothetical protein
MKQFSTVEEYLEVLAGLRDVVSGNVKSGWMFASEPIVNLARYDVNFVDTVSQTTIANQPLTDRQAELTCKILLKYSRQLAKKGIDVEPVNRPIYRLPLREIDRTRSLYLKDNFLHLRFSYNNQIITDLKEAAKIANGTLKWNSNLKVWLAGLTEPILIIAVDIAQRHGFTIDQEVLDLYKLVQTAEAEPYAIELQLTDQGCVITNAPVTMTEYINEYLGGFAHDNLYRLVDYSSVLGYTVSSEIYNAIETERRSLSGYLVDRHIKTKSKIENIVLEEIVEYADLTDRWPIYVYDPSLRDSFKKTVLSLLPQDQIIDAGMGKDVVEFLPKGEKKLVFMNKYNVNMENTIPLLVSTQGMMFGGEKSLLLQRAEKVVFFAEDVYTSKKK